MGNDIRDLNSVESMLDDLFEMAKASDEKLACCKCTIDNREYIAAMDIINASYITTLVFSPLQDDHLIVNIRKGEDWIEAANNVSDFVGCSDQNELTVSSYASYWYSRLETNSEIVTDSIEQKRKFFICCYPETFEDHYDPYDETGRNVVLITELSDDFKQVHFYVHFEYSGEAFHLSGATDSPELLWNLYCEFCDREEALQVKEREELNRFYPKNKYDAADYPQIKSMFLKAVNTAFKSDVGIESFRFRTDAGCHAATIIAVSSELNEVRVVIHNIDRNDYYSRTVSGRHYFEETFAVDLYIALFPQEAKVIYNKVHFEPLFDKIRLKITEILDLAAKEGRAICSFQAVDKEIPELGSTYSAEAIQEKDGKDMRLIVKCSYKKKLLFEHTVEIGMQYEDMFSKLYQFLYPERIALLREDILE